MINKDFLSSGAVDEKSTNNLYAAHPQAKIKARFSAKVLACLIASFSSFANLVLMFIYVVNPKMNITTITLINIGFLVIVINCFFIIHYAQQLLYGIGFICQKYTTINNTKKQLLFKTRDY